MNRSKRHETVSLGVLAALVITCAPAWGSSVVPMTMPHMADRAAQVISGRVSSVHSYWAQNPRRIESEVMFDGVNYLKGAPRVASSTYRLVVPGGKIEQMEMRLCCVPQFRTGDTWILFVLPEYKTFPVVGLYRGAFRTAKDAQGVLRVHSSDGQAVVGLNAAGHIQIATGSFDPHTHLLGSVNAEVRMREHVTSAAKAMTVQDFLAEIQPILDASRDHRLTGPAGRRIPVVYTPTALSIRESTGGSPRASLPESRIRRAVRAVNQQWPSPARTSTKSGDRR